MKKIWIRSGVERISSTRTEIGQAVARHGDADDREDEAERARR